jgi:hypothetical protein
MKRNCVNLTFESVALDKGEGWFEHEMAAAEEEPGTANTLHYLRLTNFEDVSLSLPFDPTIPMRTMNVLRSGNESVRIKMAIRYYSAFDKSKYSLSLCAQHTQDRCQDMVPTGEKWLYTQFDWNWVEAEQVEVRLRFYALDGQALYAEHDDSATTDEQVSTIVIIQDMDAEFVLSNDQKLDACSLRTYRSDLKLMIDSQLIRKEHEHLFWTTFQLPELPAPSADLPYDHDELSDGSSDLSFNSLLYTTSGGVLLRLKLSGPVRQIEPNEEICVHTHYWVAANRFLQIRIKQVNQKKRLNLPKLWPTYTPDPDRAMKDERFAWYPAKFCFNWFLINLHRFQTNQLELEFVAEGDASFGQLVMQRSAANALIALSRIRVQRSFADQSPEDLSSLQTDDEYPDSSADPGAADEMLSDEENFAEQFDLFDEYSASRFESNSAQQSTIELTSPEPPPIAQLHEPIILESIEVDHPESNLNLRTQAIRHSQSSNMNQWSRLLSQVPQSLRTQWNGARDSMESPTPSNPLNNFLSSWNANAAAATKEWHLLTNVPRLCKWFHNTDKNQLTLRYRPSPVLEAQTMYVFSHWFHVQSAEMITFKVQSTLRGGHLKIELLNDQFFQYNLYTEFFLTWPLEKESQLFFRPHVMDMYTKNTGKIKFTIFQDFNADRPSLQKLSLDSQTRQEVVPTEEPLEGDNDSTFDTTASSWESESVDALNWPQSNEPIAYTRVEVRPKTLAEQWDEEDLQWQNGDWRSVPELLLITQVQMSDPCHDSNLCNSRGRCVTSSATKFNCVCMHNFHGERCEFENRCRLPYEPIHNRTGYDFCRSNGAIDCRPIENWFDCHCPASQRWDVHERQCVPISPCLFKICPDREVCRVQSDRSARCECRTGYVRQNGQCELDLCRPNPCKPGQLCRTQPGRNEPLCFCKFGYFFDPAKQKCEPDSPSKRNPFIVQKLGCSHTYVYEPKSGSTAETLRCACFTGYRLDRDEKTCKPLDSFQKNRCPPCNQRQICVLRSLSHVYNRNRLYNPSVAMVATDAVYRCSCRVGFFGRDCSKNVCQTNRLFFTTLALNEASPQVSPQANELFRMNSSRRATTSLRSVRSTLSGDTLNQAVRGSSRSQRISTRSRARNPFQTAFESLVDFASSQVDEGLESPEREALRFYCQNSDCVYSNEQFKFRCLCPTDLGTVYEPTGMCRLHFVCDAHEQAECSSRGAVCVPRIQSSSSASSATGPQSTLVAQCECPPGFAFSSDRICQSICDFASKTCELLQADKCESGPLRNQARCLCQAGHVFDPTFGRCVVAKDVLRVRMNVRLNLFWPPESALNTAEADQAAPSPSLLNEFGYEDDLFVLSSADSIIGPKPFVPELPNTQPALLDAVDCLQFHQTADCVDWLQQVRNQQRQFAQYMRKHLQLRMRMRQSLQLTFDQLVGPEAMVKVSVLSLPKESSGTVSDFTVEFTVDVMRPERFVERKLLDLFKVTCVHIDRLNQVRIQPPLLVDSVKYLTDESGTSFGFDLLFVTSVNSQFDVPNADKNEEDDENGDNNGALLGRSEWRTAMVEADEWPMELNPDSTAIEGCAFPSGLYVVDRKMETRSINLCDTTAGKPLRCKAYSKCGKRRTDNSRYRCKCARGYEKVHSKFTGLFEMDFCRDINECIDPELNKCDRNSYCVNTIGSYKCRCLPGYKKANLFSCKSEYLHVRPIKRQ